MDFSDRYKKKLIKKLKISENGTQSDVHFDTTLILKDGFEAIDPNSIATKQLLMITETLNKHLTTLSTVWAILMK